MKANYITPAVTLFQEDGTLDLESQGKLFEHLIANGIDGILVQGSIGEFFAMDLEMRKNLAGFAIRSIAHRVRCIIGTASMVESEIVPYSNWCLEQGADAVMIISPYYFRFDDASLFRFYDELFSQIHGAVYIYNFPDRTGYSISPQVVLELRRKHDNLKGIKDTISGMDHTRELIKAVKSEFPDFEVFSGFDDNAAHNVLSGGDGIIGGLSNVVPELCSAWIRAMRENDAEGIAAGQQQINRLFDIYAVGALFVPIIKEGCRLRGVVGNSICTKPIPEVTAEQTEEIRKILAREGITV